MTATQELSERERQVLHAVVHTYITTAEPVGSRAVVKRFDLNVSAATARNTMADLEDSGFLKQVHTSSGRVPTDKGYRYYVKHLMRVQELSLEERRRIEQEFNRKLNDVDEVLRQTSHLLALMTHQAGIAEAPDDETALIQRIELMPITETRLAVLIVDNYGRVRTVTVLMDMPLGAEELPVLNRFLNDHLHGVEVHDLKRAVEKKLRTFFDEQRKLAEQALSVLNLLPAWPATQLYLEGASQLFDQPEFTDIVKAREVFGLFEERERVADLLRTAVLENATMRSSVVIGAEGTELEGLSLVASPYEVAGRRVGLVGILGPRRMPYSRLTAVVDYTSEMVGRFLTRLSSA